ncbi:translation initiation factor IF-2, mitochondrial-like [Saccostrea echinata]|uniref:translation initiation factor IF-2, mitochondrial-like n=1 Tax=Saccostrea echinata TaxID=191078 RepID=UPI002A804F87|nr:translation initiation factor IF-2, mitochondrial-like [Saccostrea echinata]
MSRVCEICFRRLLTQQRLTSHLQNASNTKKLTGLWNLCARERTCTRHPYTGPRQAFHTSSIAAGLDDLLRDIEEPSEVLNQKRRKTFESNKIPHKPKSVEQMNVKVFKGMTLVELSRNMNIDLDKILEVILKSPEYESIEDENTEINDLDLLSDICRTFRGNPIMTGRDMAKQVLQQDIPRQAPPDPKTLVSRPPVITIMGHIDHGKTTLLDTLRKSNVVSQEFGGITQHIGAFSVTTPSGNQITFLDTPGHAAFSAMRERGAIVTDIIVLVVAADDGTMPQTLESIEHARKHNVPMVIAINKIDRPNADIQRTLNSLLEHGIQTELNGGDIPAVPISALKGENIDELQETIAVQAELLDLKCDTKGLVEGHILESKLNPKTGKVATILVQRGILKTGAIVVAGEAYGKIKSMVNDKGQAVKSVSPSFCAEVTGWRELPVAGDEVLQFKDRKTAQAVVNLISRKNQIGREEMSASVEERRQEHQKTMQELRQLKQKNFQLYRMAKEKVVNYGDVPSSFGEVCLPIILKGDVYGSIEALVGMFSTFDSQLCELRVVHQDVGPVGEADLNLAASLKADIFSFNVPVPEEIKLEAKKKNIIIKENNVIYKLIDDLKDSANERIPPIEEEDIIGEAEVQKVYEYKLKDGKRNVAGCRCVQGNLQRKLRYKVIRDGEEVFRGKLDSLKHHKDEVETIGTGMECGMLVKDSQFQFEEGDLVQCIDTKYVTKTVDWAPDY